MKRATALLLLAFAIALGGCGGGSDKPTIPHDEGATLLRHLQKARDAAGDPQQCDRLTAAVAAAQSDVQSLPSSVDKDTRDSLVNGVDNLQETARSECENAQTTDTTTTPTDTTPTTTTETTAPTTTTETQTQTTTTETAPPTTGTQTTPPQVPTETVPGNGNGNGNGGAGAKGDPGSAPGQPKKPKKPKKGPKK
jgi:hypothetical protein